jgi:CHAT domain-containing protein
MLPGQNDTAFILTTQNGSLSIKGGVGEKALNQLTGELRHAIAARKPEYLQSAAKLYETLIGPVRPLLQEAKIEQLMLYLIDGLRYVPVAALYDATEKKYLIEQYTLSIYTAAVRDKLKESAKSQWLAVAFGMSKAKPPYEALPSVIQELLRVVREETEGESGILPGNRYLDEKFTRKQLLTVLDEQTPHSVMHIATHFKFVPGNQEQSVLLLGDGDEMSLRELNTDQGIRLANYDLVTLSACDTAVSSTAKGEEVEGLAVILQKRGAKSVLATLWKVQDEGTARLMEQFYRERGEQRQTSKAEALRRAQVAFLHGGIKSSNPQADLRHPYYWAPFVLMGNWM